MTVMTVMTGGGSHLRLMGSVERWLLAMPGCSVGLEGGFSRLCDPKVLALVFRLILDDEFELAGGEGDTAISVVDRLVEYFHIAEVKRFDELSRLRLLLDVERLTQGDSRQLYILCILVVRIGVFGLKSSLCASAVSILNQEDRLELERAIYGDAAGDVHVENSILVKELRRMDSELQQSNGRAQALEKELCRLQRLNSSMEQHLRLVDDANGALQLHRDEIERLKITNKRYKDSILQWERDFAQLQRYNPPSPTRRVRIAHHDHQLHNPQQQQELVYLQWQYNTLTQWISKLI